MSFASSLTAQIAAVVDSLSKAAVAEISQLVEEGSLVLRLEMCRKDAEIQELRRSLKRMEVDLCNAEEAATTRRTAEDFVRGGERPWFRAGENTGPNLTQKLCNSDFVFL